MTSSHTPSPWETDGGIHVQAIYNPTDGGKPFFHAVARTDQPYVPPVQQSANSRLIAAAPEMLEALEETNNWIRHWLEDVACGLMPTVESLIKLRVKNCAAIAKAKGEKQATQPLCKSV